MNTLTLTLEQFGQLRDRLAQYSGVYLDETRQSALAVGVARRLAATGLSLPAYLAMLLRSAQSNEHYQLAELVLNHETVFFRNQPQFRALREVILPELHRRLPPSQPIRIWSAGCATGEEPYSLAITALATLGQPLPRPVEIIASDLSQPALAKARAGIYRGRTLSNLRNADALRYVEQRGDSCAVRPEVRQLVTFVQHNLLEPFPSAVQGVDLIFCQNVTIYFQLETCRALMSRFYTTLADHGYLFLGFSESLWNIFPGFRSHEVAGAFLYRKAHEATRSAKVTQPLRPLEVAQQTAQRAVSQRAPQTAQRAVSTAFVASADQTLVVARELLNTGQAEAALEHLRSIPLAGANAPAVLALMARANADKGELDLAAAQAHRALELDALTTEAYILLGMIYARQGQPAEALAQLERARYLAADVPLVAFYLAEINRQLGKTQAALREYRNAKRRLDALPPDDILDGVAVKWLRETCQRNIVQLQAGRD
jgi:chemotaxis protein methyltransferase CheR